MTILSGGHCRNIVFSVSFFWDLLFAAHGNVWGFRIVTMKQQNTEQTWLYYCSIGPAWGILRPSIGVLIVVPTCNWSIERIEPLLGEVATCVMRHKNEEY